MDKPLVTVVIPVYNVETYLDRCMRSIVGQTYQNLEILMIDDGSTDHSSEMCDEWAKNDGRIRVIHKKNAGASEARNTGIDNAQGEYICFCDSDDYVDTGTIEKCLARLMKYHADVAIFGVNFVNAKGYVTASHPPIVGEYIYRGKEVRDVFLPELIAPNVRKDGRKSFYMTNWIMLYSMEVIRRSGWHFASERSIYSEDVYSLLEFFAGVSTVAVVPEALYYYCENTSSLSRKYVPGRYNKIRHFFRETQALCESIGYSDTIRHRIIRPFLAFTIAALKQELISDKHFSERYQDLRNILNDDVLQEALFEIRKDVVGRNRKILFFCMRKKQYLLCYILLRYKAG